MQTDALLKAEIEAGAWVTPSGDPIIAVHLTDEGPCTYCGEQIVGYVAETQSGMRQACPGKPALVWRWFNGQFEAWHIDCFEKPGLFFDWTMNANRTVHIVGCRHAHADKKNEQTFHGMRGEARHAFDYTRFCGHCAPLSRWLDQ